MARGLTPRLRRTQLTTDRALPTPHKTVNATIAQTNWDDSAIRTTFRPHTIAASPTRENLTRRMTKTIASNRIRGYANAAAALITALKGDGGGAMQATAIATPACWAIRFLR